MSPTVVVTKLRSRVELCIFSGRVPKELDTDRLARHLGSISGGNRQIIIIRIQ